MQYLLSCKSHFIPVDYPLIVLYCLYRIPYESLGMTRKYFEDLRLDGIHHHEIAPPAEMGIKVFVV